MLKKTLVIKVTTISFLLSIYTLKGFTAFNYNFYTEQIFGSGKNSNNYQNQTNLFIKQAIDINNNVSVELKAEATTIKEQYNLFYQTNNSAFNYINHANIEIKTSNQQFAFGFVPSVNSKQFYNDVFYVKDISLTNNIFDILNNNQGNLQSLMFTTSYSNLNGYGFRYVLQGKNNIVAGISYSTNEYGTKTINNQYIGKISAIDSTVGYFNEYKAVAYDIKLSNRNYFTQSNTQNLYFDNEYSGLFRLSYLGFTFINSYKTNTNSILKNNIYESKLGYEFFKLNMQLNYTDSQISSNTENLTTNILAFYAMYSFNKTFALKSGAYSKKEDNSESYGGILSLSVRLR